MLKDCKFSKFREINFKILAWILLTPKILAAIKKDPNLAQYKWCGCVGTLKHILLEYSEVWKARQDFVRDNRKLLGSWREKYWILGTKQASVNQIIWVVNFAIYKAFLQSTEGFRDNILILIQSKYAWFANLFPILQDLQ